MSIIEITKRLQSKRVRESTEANIAIEAMLEVYDSQDTPYIGSFWYDTEEDELFGVYKAVADDVAFYKSSQFKAKIRTGKPLHKTIWNKEKKRGRDPRFQEDYTDVPRGRVFEFEDKGFYVFTGEWINNYPGVKDLIIDEFELPEDTTFEIDEHWDIGHGWSQEF